MSAQSFLFPTLPEVEPAPPPPKVKRPPPEPGAPCASFWAGSQALLTPSGWVSSFAAYFLGVGLSAIAPGCQRSPGLGDQGDQDLFSESQHKQPSRTIYRVGDGEPSVVILMRCDRPPLRNRRPPQLAL